MAGDFPFEAVSFDVDGTLYDKRLLKRRILFTMPFSIPFIRHVMEARETLRHRAAMVRDFKSAQVAILSRRLALPKNKVEKKLEKVIYRKLPALLKGIRPFSGLEGVLEDLVKRGVRLAILSDFPAQAKLDALGLSRFPWSVVLHAESLGVLKPHEAPFLKLAEKLDLEPPAILHVGDRADCDVAGALSAGFKAMLFNAAGTGKYEPSFTDWEGFLQSVNANFG